MSCYRIEVVAYGLDYLHGRAAAGGEPAPTEVTRLPWDSTALSCACGVEPPPEEERHTALGDARWAARLYDAITGGGSR